MNKAIILLSGGLDSLVSLSAIAPIYRVKYALTFDYGQRANKEEVEASKKISNYYGIEHKVIKLDWLKEITQTALVNNNKNLVFEELGQISAKSVWVPNRNGAFVNIAASFCDSFDIDFIIIGANKEEAKNFSDNSEDFIKKINDSLEFSTQKKPKVIAPLINSDKEEIIKIALDIKAPLNLMKSCYEKGEKHCGKCESCKRLLGALQKNNCKELIQELF